MALDGGNSMTNACPVTVRRDDQDPQLAVIVTEGYINNLVGEQVGQAAMALLDEGRRKLVINLEKSTVINSIGISILIEVLEKTQELQGALAFCHLTRTIAKTFQIMGLAQYAQLLDTEDEALRAMRS